MTSKWRRCDVVTSHRRHYDVMCLLGIWPPLDPQYSKPWPPNFLNLPTPMILKMNSSRNYPDGESWSLGTETMPIDESTTHRAYSVPRRIKKFRRSNQIYRKQDDQSIAWWFQDSVVKMDKKKLINSFINKYWINRFVSQATLYSIKELYDWKVSSSNKTQST